MSRSEARNMVVVDAGLKAVSLNSGPPLLPATDTDGIQVGVQGGIQVGIQDGMQV